MRKLTTERLALEPVTEAHAAEMFRAAMDPIIYTFLHDRPPFTEEELRARYRFLASRASRDGRSEWLTWILRDSATGEAIGHVQAERYARGVAGLSVVLVPAAWRRGLAREAVAAAIHELATHGRVQRFFATIPPRNDAALRLFERLGFRLQDRATFDLRALDNGDLVLGLGHGEANPAA